MSNATPGVLMSPNSAQSEHLTVLGPRRYVESPGQQARSSFHRKAIEQSVTARGAQPFLAAAKCRVG